MNLTQTIREFYGFGKTQGDLGIEIELEGSRLPRIDTEYWATELDHSLKAQEAYEYVSCGPKTFEEARASLEELNHVLKENKSIVHNSYRAGVHCHVNVQELTWKELANFLTLAICFESILLEDCGEDRAGNLFCLRVRDAEGVIDQWSDVYTGGRLTRDSLVHMKYAFTNLSSVPRFGSLEFRGMRSTTDPKVLLPWFEKLLALREASQQYGSPSEIVEQFSVNGARDFAFHVFGKRHVTNMKQEAEIWKDLRYAQDFAFCRGW